MAHHEINNYTESLVLPTSRDISGEVFRADNPINGEIYTSSDCHIRGSNDVTVRRRVSEPPSVPLRILTRPRQTWFGFRMYKATRLDFTHRRRDGGAHRDGIGRSDGIFARNDSKGEIIQDDS